MKRILSVLCLVLLADLDLLRVLQQRALGPVRGRGAAAAGVHREGGVAGQLRAAGPRGRGRGSGPQRARVRQELGHLAAGERRVRGGGGGGGWRLRAGEGGHTRAVRGLGGRDGGRDLECPGCRNVGC